MKDRVRLAMEQTLNAPFGIAGHVFPWPGRQCTNEAITEAAGAVRDDYNGRVWSKEAETELHRRLLAVVIEMIPGTTCRQAAIIASNLAAPGSIWYRVEHGRQ